MANWVARTLNFRAGELPLATLGALFYFFVLCGYFFLRPVREAMGVSRGMDDLRWLFVVTSFVSLVIVLLFGGVVSRLNRRRFLPIGFLFVIVCLVLFAGLLVGDVASGGGLIGTDTQTGLSRAVGYGFYTWLSAINLFVNSLFWAFMVDIFTVEQGKRLFAFIGIGGTLGAVVGGWSTNVISGMTESAYLPVGLMLTGAGLFGLAIAVMSTLDRATSRLKDSRRVGEIAALGDETIGGSFWDGATSVARSPYLLGIALYVVFLAVSNTLIYFTQASIVLASTDTFSERVAGFAQFDALAEGATLFVQVFITTRIIRRLGVGWTLALLPLVTAGGFGVLAVWPMFGVMAMFQAVHRATRYAVSRPARETLFSVVPQSEKYKAKTMIDVVLYRGGDVAGAAIQGALSGLGTIALMAAASVPFAAVWCGLSVALGRAQQNRDLSAPPAPGDEPERATRAAAPVG